MDLAKYVIPTMEAVEVNDISEDNVPAWIDNCNEKQLIEALLYTLSISKTRPLVRPISV
jgi:hypothetical protein